MLKRILLSLFVLLCWPVFAQQTVQVVWPFSMASANASMLRALIETANLQQSEYNFVLVNKPGAGGAVAVQSVISTKELSILTITSSYYIRPLLFKDSYSTDQLSMLNEICSNQPLGIFSTKIKKIIDVPNDKNLSIGINPGSVTNLVSRAIVDNNSSIRLVEVGYKGTPEATTDMLGGHLDSSVDFIGPSTTQRFTGNVYTLGITGTHDRFGMKTFQSQGVKGLEHVTASQYVFVRSDLPADLKRKLSDIFSKAGTNSQTKLFCEQDGGYVNIQPYSTMDQINATNIARWTALTKNIPKQ